MNTSILPKGSRLINGVQYLAAYIAIDGAFIIARKIAAMDGSNFDYYQTKDEQQFSVVWPQDADKLTYTATLETAANLAVLFNQVFDLPGNSAPTKVEVMSDENPVRVEVVNRADTQKVFVVNATVGANGTMQTSSALTDEQLRATPVPVALTFPASQAVTGPLTNEQLRAAPLGVQVAFPASQAVTAHALPLPDGAATQAGLEAVVVALQAVAQQLAATLTVTATGHVSIDNFPAAATQAVTGTVNVGNLPAKYWPDTQPVSGSVTVGNFPATQAVTGKFWQNTQPVSGDFYQAVQPVSASSLPLPTGAATAQGQSDELAQLLAITTKLGGPLTFTLPSGAATSAKQDTGNTSLNSIDTKLGLQATAARQDAGNASLTAIGAQLAGNLTVTGPATDAQLRATPLPVSVNFPAVQPVSATAWPLPTGAATAALQATANGYLQTLATAGFTATVQSGPATPYSLVSATGNNASLVKSGATQLLGLTVTNATSAYRYLMLYNSAAAPATGAAPLITLGVPPNQSITLPIPGNKYLAFSAGLSLAVGTSANLGTLVAGLLGATGVAAGDMVICAVYS